MSPPTTPTPSSPRSPELHPSHWHRPGIEDRRTSLRRTSGDAAAVARVIRTALLIGTAAGLAVACGSDEACSSIACAQEVAAPLANDDSNEQDRGGSLVDDLTGGGDDLSQPTELQETCREVAFGTEASPVNVHIVLDRSVSMNEPVNLMDPDGPTRWDAMTSALRSFLQSPLANGAKIGLQFFGVTDGDDDCSMEKYMTPAVEVGFLADVRADLLATLDATRPGSLTPTGPALEGALAHAREMAQLPENEGRPTVVVLASDGLPSECFPTDDTGQTILSYSAILETLEAYSVPPEGSALDPIRTYIVGTTELSINADTLAQAGGGQAYLVGGESGANVEADFLDALLSIVLRPLTCTLEVPQMAPDNGEMIDYDQVRVSFTGASSGSTREIPRSTSGPTVCSSGDAWYYDNPAQPTSIVFCPNTCSRFGAGDLKIELGCAPVIR